MPLYEYERCDGDCKICGGKFTIRRPVNVPVIKITEPTAVRVWMDITEQVEEANEGNNIKQVLLKPEPAK